MYRITSTGKNPNYGKRGERKLISDWHYNIIKNKHKDWFYKAKYDGVGVGYLKIEVLQDD